MSTEAPSPPDSLEAKSPFELRVNQSGGVQESFVKKSLDSGDVGFLHSFTTGSAVDGPGVRVVAWTAGCQWRCRYCHNPDTWSMTNGMAVPLERAVDELRKYRRGLQVMSGGFTVERRRAADAGPVRREAAARRPRRWGFTPRSKPTATWANASATRSWTRSIWSSSGIKSWGERHQDLTGKDIGPTLDFARRLAARKRPIWVRFVLVPGLTDDQEIVASIAKFAASLGNVAARRGAAVPSDGTVQVGETRTRLHAQRRSAAPRTSWLRRRAGCFAMKDWTA